MGAPAAFSEMDGIPGRDVTRQSMFDDQGVYPLQSMVGVAKIDKLSTWYHLIKLWLLVNLMDSENGLWLMVNSSSNHSLTNSGK